MHSIKNMRYVTKLVFAWIWILDTLWNWFWLGCRLWIWYEIDFGLNLDLVLDLKNYSGYLWNYDRFEPYVWSINMFKEIQYVFKAHIWTFEWNMLYVCIKYGYERAISMIWQALLSFGLQWGLRAQMTWLVLGNHGQFSE